MIAVCKALKAHGVRGEVKVECYTDTPASLAPIKILFSDNIEYKTERVKPFGNFALIKFIGIDDMTKAEKLRNKTFFARREDMPSPEKGAYYIDDLNGCVVFDESGKRIGIVKEILQYGSADVFVLSESGKTIMFPHLQRVIASVSVQDKTITVDKNEFEKVAVYED